MFITLEPVDCTDPQVQDQGRFRGADPEILAWC